MRVIAGYVENDANMADDHWSVAWAFDLEFWGVCGQGPDEAAAVGALATLTGRTVEVIERITGDEQAFGRDFAPATDAERGATQRILDDLRPRTVEFLRASPDDLLDWDDPDRALPPHARWRTLRLMGWHVADTECRYYLPSLGLPAKPRDAELMAELHTAHDFVRTAVATMPGDLVHRDRGEVWTSTKVLRRLAWHERGELAAMRDLAMRHPGRSIAGPADPGSSGATPR